MGFVLVVFFLVLIVVDIVEVLVGGENGFVVFIGDLGKENYILCDCFDKFDVFFL